MASTTLKDQVRANSAKITALTMIVESLLVDHLAQDEDPVGIGNAIMDSLSATEQAARAKVGGSAYALQISEAASSMVDRAVRRAVSLRSKRHPSR